MESHNIGDQSFETDLIFLLHLSPVTLIPLPLNSPVTKLGILSESFMDILVALRSLMNRRKNYICGMLILEMSSLMVRSF